MLQNTEVLVAFDAGSREEVQQTIARAKELGATIYSEPQDHGWMYQHSFADLDGHQWALHIWISRSSHSNKMIL